jgi:5-methylcytosine-specific restriction endonuclease McrA
MPIFIRKRKSGVSRIVRDSYSNDKTDWYSINKDVKKRDGNRCVACGKLESVSNKICHEVHHIVPLSKGGTTTMRNLCTLCKDCHKKRHRHL